MTEFPRMIVVRQKFPAHAPLNIRQTVEQELKPLSGTLKPGQRIAVGVGSRGISNLREIVENVLRVLKSAGTKPFIIPAMGSHGGATPEGQTALLAEYGITEEALQVPIHASMEVDKLGQTEDGFPIYSSREGMQADGILLINRVKPHTDFSGEIGSGLLKMLVVGLGKRTGAANFHVAASRYGYEKMLRTLGSILLRKTPLLGGLAILENQLHDTALLKFVLPDTLQQEEDRLFQESRRLMPKLPFNDVDLLIIDRLGKNISGAGMDPNVTGRSIHGYVSSPDGDSKGPVVRRLFVRELTAETHGNATGIGMADFTTTRLVKAIDYPVTVLNVLTALSVQSAKLPIHFDTDREVITQALLSLALPNTREAKVMRIADTLSVQTVEVSAAYRSQAQSTPSLEVIRDEEEMHFDANHNLTALAHGH